MDNERTEKIIKKLQEFIENQNEIILNQEKIINKLNAANSFLLEKLMEKNNEISNNDKTLQ